MGLIVSGIVEVSMNKIALWISVDADDWTAESVIIASNVVIHGVINAMMPVVILKYYNRNG